MPRIRVKICGLTNEEDARAAIAAGADALGFNFWPGSKRFIEPEESLPWMAKLPATVTRVAVAVDPSLELALRWLDLPGVDALQLHGSESPEFCAQLEARGHRIIKAIRLENADSLAVAARFSATRPVLFDAFQPGEHGGTGQLANWKLAAEFSRSHPETRLILAGGLNPENVTAAVRRVQPFAVDVASGVEQSGSPRRKDLSRLRDFFSALAAAQEGAKSAASEGPQGLF